MDPLPMIVMTAALLTALASPIYCEDTMKDAALGAKVFVDNCSRCHEPPDPISRNSREWRTVIMHMRVYADLSRTDEHNVLQFLRTYNTVSMTRRTGAPATR